MMIRVRVARGCHRDMNAARPQSGRAHHNCTLQVACSVAAVLAILLLPICAATPTWSRSEHGTTRSLAAAHEAAANAEFARSHIGRQLADHGIPLSDIAIALDQYCSRAATSPIGSPRRRRDCEVVHEWEFAAAAQDLHLSGAVSTGQLEMLELAARAKGRAGHGESDAVQNHRGREATAFMHEVHNLRSSIQLQENMLAEVKSSMVKFAFEWDRLKELRAHAHMGKLRRAATWIRHQFHKYATSYTTKERRFDKVLMHINLEQRAKSMVDALRAAPAEYQQVLDKALNLLTDDQIATLSPSPDDMSETQAQFKAAAAQLRQWVREAQQPARTSAPPTALMRTLESAQDLQHLRIRKLLMDLLRLLKGRAADVSKTTLSSLLPQLFVEGMSAALMLATGGTELVYDFRTREIAKFNFGGITVGTSVGASGSLYMGVCTKGTLRAAPLRDAYSGAFVGFGGSLSDAVKLPVFPFVDNLAIDAAGTATPLEVNGLPTPVPDLRKVVCISAGGSAGAQFTPESSLPSVSGSMTNYKYVSGQCFTSLTHFLEGILFAKFIAPIALAPLHFLSKAVVLPLAVLSAPLVFENVCSTAARYAKGTPVHMLVHMLHQRQQEVQEKAQELKLMLQLVEDHSSRLEQRVKALTSMPGCIEAQRLHLQRRRSVLQRLKSLVWKDPVSDDEARRSMEIYAVKHKLEPLSEFVCADSAGSDSSDSSERDSREGPADKDDADRAQELGDDGYQEPINIEGATAVDGGLDEDWGWDGHEADDDQFDLPGASDATDALEQGDWTAVEEQGAGELRGILHERGDAGLVSQR